MRAPGKGLFQQKSPKAGKKGGHKKVGPEKKLLWSHRIKREGRGPCGEWGDGMAYLVWKGRGNVAEG